MRNFWVAAMVGLVVIVYVTTINPTPPPPTVPMAPVVDPFQPLWSPDVFTDCETWEIRQSPAALEDVWPQVDYMTVDGAGYGADDVIRLPREGDRSFLFQFYADGHQVYSIDLVAETHC